mgnify:CR=1 FL=1
MNALLARPLDDRQRKLLATTKAVACQHGHVTIESSDSSGNLEIVVTRWGMSRVFTGPDCIIQFARWLEMVTGTKLVN